jgi:hypothetical protein
VRRLAALSAPQGLLVSLFLLAAAAVAYQGHAWLEMGVLVWLAPLAAYDLEHRATPHTGWIYWPWLLACGYVAWRGDWQLALTAELAFLASERSGAPLWRKVAVGLAVTMSLGALALSFSAGHAIGALALLGFWGFFELGWWAGVDALAAMALIMLWPNLPLLAALATAHLGLSLVQRRGGPFRFPGVLKPGDLEAIGEPGLPALALTIAIYLIINVVGSVGGRVTG